MSVQAAVIEGRSLWPCARSSRARLSGQATRALAIRSVRTVLSRLFRLAAIIASPSCLARRALDAPYNGQQHCPKATLADFQTAHKIFVTVFTRTCFAAITEKRRPVWGAFSVMQYGLPHVATANILIAPDVAGYGGSRSDLVRRLVRG